MKHVLLFCMLLAATYCSAQTVEKGGVTQIMNGGRVVDGQELTSLAQLPFTRGVGAPFTILLLPKSADNLKEIEVIKGKYYQGDTLQNIPLSIAVWNSVALREIDIDNPTLFVNYYVYIGFGQDIPGI